ncbi:MAG: SDR family oxidoreductase [Spongiibacteraceae bacterium]|nr:SDR family oxidoreductase [Spongiibacteraceae bacterium]
MKVLLNKVALITGASSGIGRATATLFAREGAKVVVAARRQKELDELVDEILDEGGQARALAGDVTQESYCKALVDLAVQDFGGLDIAFNNAGTLGVLGEVPQMLLEDWQQTININLDSAFLGAKYQLPAMMRDGGSIIFTSSFVGYTLGMPQTAAYAASKAGIVGLTKALACEYGSVGIRVNALLPGGTATTMADQFASSVEEKAFVEGMHALKRLAAPEEIARSALYLASDASTFTTGSAMLVDGGVSICKT